MESPSPNEIIEGYRAFQRYEKRDAMYKTATFLVDYFWGKPAEMANSLGVLLLTWNQAFHRYGIFDFDKLEECISNNLNLLDQYRHREIVTYVPDDDETVRYLFQQFLIALQIYDGNKNGATSPVGTSKALHLLSPGFFPIWDGKIARAYGYNHLYRPVSTYLLFFNRMKELADKLQRSIDTQESGKTLLKLIDEYNYAKFTKRWI